MAQSTGIKLPILVGTKAAYAALESKDSAKFYVMNDATGDDVTLSLRGDISTDTVNSVVIMVIGFYFGSQYEQDRKRTRDTAETFGTTETTETATTPVARAETEGV